MGHFSDAFGIFIGVGGEKAESLLTPRDNRGGRAHLSATELLCALTYHCIHGIGALSSNLKRVINVQMSDAGIFKTRQRVSVEMMRQISDHCLNVRSDLANEPFSFYGDRLLVAIDGTSFDLKNTEDVARHFTKAKARRSKDVEAKEAAFARINVSCLVELGLHNPLAVEVGSDEDSEVTLGNKLVDRIPVDCMFLADRLYGNACFADKLLSRFKGSRGAFVIRVGASTTSQEVVKRLPDGSAIIRVPLRNRDRPATIDRYVIVREIRSELKKRNGELVQLRFWTNLLDSDVDPAIRLVELYAKRWEHELYFNELKNELKTGRLLKSRNLLCAQQEIIVAVWSSSLIASVRGAVNREVDCDIRELKISFPKTLDKMQTIWNFVSLVADEITPELIDQAIGAALEELKKETIPRRTNRSCPRTIRKNVIDWPKTKCYQPQYGQIEARIISI